MELDTEAREVTTRFADGTEAYGTPHETPEYHAHAIEKTGVDDTLLYCWQHDLMHVIVAELKGVPSPVLWRLAHGQEPDTPACEEEEIAAQNLQRVFQMRHPVEHQTS